MFTGLIEEVGVVKSISRVTVGKLLVISEKVINEVQVGDSVSVSGVCLTVTSMDDGVLAFDAVPETLSRTILTDLRAGDRVNLETSLGAGQPIGGHFVQGHVDEVGVIKSISAVGDSWTIGINASQEFCRYVVEKGSVAVDGISLTVASCEETGFAIAVIPHTLSNTALHVKKQGDKVNLEADIIGKYVEKFVKDRGGSSGVSEEMLRETGFM